MGVEQGRADWALQMGGFGVVWRVGFSLCNLCGLVDEGYYVRSKGYAGFLSEDATTEKRPAFLGLSTLLP